LAGYLYRRSSNGQVADYAIYSAADELDCSGFRDAVARCDPSFDHKIKMPRNSKKSINSSAFYGEQLGFLAWLALADFVIDPAPACVATRIKILHCRLPFLSLVNGL
jgi:hypothetical protein